MSCKINIIERKKKKKDWFWYYSCFWIKNNQKNPRSHWCSQFQTYSYKFCPLKASAGGTLIYIRNCLWNKTRNDLKIYKSFELGSTFMEICNPKKTNITIGCIYKHPNVNITEFNDDYLNELFDKLSQESKTIFILGNVNINLLNYDIHPPTNEFLDSLPSHHFHLHTLHSTA